MAGVMIARKIFPPEKRRASLDFDYSDEELEQIHNRQLPEQSARQLRAKGKRLSRQAAKRGGVAGLLLLAVFALAASSSGARENNTSLAIMLVGVGSLVAFLVLGQVLLWFKYHRKANVGIVRVITEPVLKEPDLAASDYKVSFGKTPFAPHWHFPWADYKALNNDALHNVYYCADMLVYLEEVEADSPDDAVIV